MYPISQSFPSVRTVPPGQSTVRFAGPPQSPPGQPGATLDRQIQNAYVKAKQAWLFQGRAYKKAANLAHKLLASGQEPHKHTVTTILLILNDMATHHYHLDTAKRVTTLLLDAADPKTASHARHTAFRLRMDISDKVVERANKLIARFESKQASAQDKLDANLTSEYMLDHRIQYPLAVELFKFR